jgi:Arc/MetJ-type ribon-helix-helix transcriptional regulator
MTVELKPETERLVQEEIQKGRAHSVDELIVRGVRALQDEQTAVAERPRKSLYELLSQPPFAGSDLVIERQKDYPRPVEL